MENTSDRSDSSNRAKGVIMVVDDTPENLRVLEKMLTEHGYRVRATLNSSLALKSVQTSLPDLILLDIKMPAPDGYEVCQWLKADERTRDVPVIFISALDEVWDKVKAFHVGGIDYITKPFQAEEVLARLPQETESAHAQALAGSRGLLAAIRRALQGGGDPLGAPSDPRGDPGRSRVAPAHPAQASRRARPL